MKAIKSSGLSPTGWTGLPRPEASKLSKSEPSELLDPKRIIDGLLEAFGWSWPNLLRKLSVAIHKIGFVNWTQCVNSAV